MLLVPSLQSCLGTDLIEVLCTGHTGSMPVMAALLGREPMTTAVIIPTRIHGITEITPKIVKRYMRLYFPRSYEDLISKYEFLLLRGIDATYFSNNQLEWMRRAFEDAGLGGLQDRSVMSSTSGYSTPWAQSSTSDAFPNDADAVIAAQYSKHGNMEVIINEDPSIPPIFTPYKDLLFYQLGQGGWTMMIPREGTQTYFWSRIPSYSVYSYPEPGMFPHTLGWRYGKSYTWSLMDYSLGGFWGEGFNPYGMDAWLGMLMYSTGRTLPEDVVMVHNLRQQFHVYAEQKGFIFSMINFVDRFGANTGPLIQQVADMDQSWKRSRDLYLEQDYASSFPIITGILEDIALLREEALRTKDRALFWIYVIEWMTVSGTFLVAGFLVWTLMVRRRLYRGVETTRLIQR
jgi:hypothetical protein